MISHFKMLGDDALDSDADPTTGLSQVVSLVSEENNTTIDAGLINEPIVVADAADLVTVKTLASGDSTPAEGDVVTFEISITNNGSDTATGVFLTDFLPDGLTATVDNGTVSQGSYDPATGIFGIGTLQVGETATLFLEGTVDAGQGGNTITNVTTAAMGDQTDPSTDGDDLEEAVDVEFIDNTTDLITTKGLDSGDNTPNEGDLVTFVINVFNDGSATATGVFLTDFLPEGLTATDENGTVSQGSYDPATGIFGIGTLEVGETATLFLEGTVDAGQGGNAIVNTTTAATGDQVDPSTDGDDLVERVVVNDAVDLITTKGLDSGDNTPNEGELVTFVINVFNNGSGTATGVFLTDFLPDGLTATDENGTVSQGSYDPATGIFGIGTLEVGETATLFLEGTVDAGQGGNRIANFTTAATGDQVDPTTDGDDLAESVDVERKLSTWIWIDFRNRFPR